MNEENGLFADAVFEGGGIRGIALAGAAAVAEDIGYQWVNLAGTSAGAIVSALLAAGYTAAELKAILEDLDYRKFRDPGWMDKIPLIGPLMSLLTENGIYEGDFVEKWMHARLKEKGVITFKDLVIPEYSDDEKYRYKLRVIASDITAGHMLTLPQDIRELGLEPDDLPVSRAVRMSISIPFFYEPVIVKNRKTGVLHYIVDGGLLSNYPVWLFDTEGELPKWPTIGFKLVEPGEDNPHTIKGPLSLLTALFSTMMQAHEYRYMKDADFVRTITIKTLGIGTTEFSLSKEKSLLLYQSGWDAAEKFFAAWDFDRYVENYRKRENPSRSLRIWPEREV